MEYIAESPSHALSLTNNQVILSHNVEYIIQLARCPIVNWTRAMMWFNSGRFTRALQLRDLLTTFSYHHIIHILFVLGRPIMLISCVVC
jgi:hypothetical protein